MPYRALATGDLQRAAVKYRLLAQAPYEFCCMYVDMKVLPVRNCCRNSADLLIASEGGNEVQVCARGAFSWRFRNQSVQI